ncbi:M24 family metallopeptidase [Pseudarthrobacter sp. NPDC058196]|uniref:M24 family metallopeptidase n=1 Tax=Pseudarthrobacter sp. NPDC058196 TaxID=3346376 RepID=UPI0036D8CE5C
MTTETLQFSSKERDRRFAELRTALKDNGFAAIALSGQHHIFGEAALRYYTNTMVLPSAVNLLLISVDDDPILFVDKPTDQYWVSRLSWISDVRLSPNHIHESLADEIHARWGTGDRIAVNGLIGWRAVDYLTLTNRNPGVEFIDADAMLMNLRGNKSEEEAHFVREATRVCSLAQEVFAASVRPGMSQAEAVAPVEHAIRAEGVEDRLWLMTSRYDDGAAWVPRDDKFITATDPIVFSAEIVRGGGYGSQIVRTYSPTEPTGQYRDMFSVRAEIRDRIADWLRPGVVLRDFAKQVIELGATAGLNVQQLGHSVGVDMADDPFINVSPDGYRDLGEWTVEAGQFFAIHPMLRPAVATPPLVWIGDVYSVGEDTTSLVEHNLPAVPEHLGW